MSLFYVVRLLNFLNDVYFLKLNCSFPYTWFWQFRSKDMMTVTLRTLALTSLVIRRERTLAISTDKPLHATYIWYINCIYILLKRRYTRGYQNGRRLMQKIHFNSIRVFGLNIHTCAIVLHLVKKKRVSRTYHSPIYPDKKI